MKDTKAAALICRVSTREQEEGYSLDAQELLLRDYCARLGLDIRLVRAFSETASKYAQRKKFLEFVNDVKRAGICHIVAEKVDRVSRSGSRDAVLIDTWVEEDEDRHLHLVKQSLSIHKLAPSTAKFVWNMHVAVAKHTSDNLSEEVRKSADVMLSRGIWPTKPLIGYVRDKSIADCPIQPETVKSELVTKMFDLYATGEWSVERLADRIFDMGLRNSLGHKIMPSRVHELLQDPFYIGKMLYRGRIWEGAHAPIVGLDVFERVQRLLRRGDGGQGAVQYSRHEHLFAGIAMCGGCGKRLTWERHDRYHYGYCKRYRTCANRARVSEPELEQALLPYLDVLAVRNGRMANLIADLLKLGSGEDGDLRTNARASLEGELKRVTQKLDRLLDLRLEGEIDKTEYEQRRAELSTEKSRLIAAVKTSDLPPRKVLDPASVYEIGREASRRYVASEPVERKKILKEVFEAVSVSGRIVTGKYTVPYELLAKAVQQSSISKLPKSASFEQINFETLKSGSGKQDDHAFAHGHPVWLAAWDDFRKRLLQEPVSLY